MKILIVGLGTIAKKHIKAINLLGNNNEIYALRSNKDAEKKEGIINLFDLESNIKFDFAIISNPTFLHEFFILKLLKMKIPLFIEKPVTHRLDNIELILNAVREQNIFTYVGCNLRFHPCIRFIKKKLAEENPVINECNIYCGSYLPNWRPDQNYNNFYSVNSIMGGGVHLDLFHEFDYMVWLFGFPLKKHSLLRNVSSLNIEAKDYANFIFEYKNFSTSIVLNYYRRKTKRSIEIVLENETLYIDLIKNMITNDNGEVLFFINDFDIQETYNLQLNYFTNSLKNNSQPMNTIQESIQILKLILNDK